MQRRDYYFFFLKREIFQAVICYNFGDYGLLLMKTPYSKLEYCEKAFINYTK